MKTFNCSATSCAVEVCVCTHTCCTCIYVSNSIHTYRYSHACTQRLVHYSHKPEHSHWESLPSEINKNVHSQRHMREEYRVCAQYWLIQGKWLLLSPLCYVTLQSNYRVCALFRGCLIMLFGLCRALGCHHVVCVRVSVYSRWEDTNCGGGVSGTATVRERKVERNIEAEGEWRKNKPEWCTLAFLLIFHYLSAHQGRI